MLPLPAGREASSGVGAFFYKHHRPERTLLYQLVEQYFPAFEAHLAAQGTDLPAYVEQEFEDYLKCGHLEHGFRRVRCDSCHAEHLVALSCKRRGCCPICGARHHGRERRATGRRCLSRAAGTPVGVERPVSVALFVRESRSSSSACGCAATSTCALSPCPSWRPCGTGSASRSTSPSGRGIRWSISRRRPPTA